jgi:hypothetical protein
MGMHHTGFLAYAVNRCMNKHSGGFDRVFAGQDIAFAVNHHDVVGGDLTPEQTTGVEQEATRVIWQLYAEVIAHPFS